MIDSTTKSMLREAMTNSLWLHIDEAIPVRFGWDLPVQYLSYCADNEIGRPTGNLSYQLAEAHRIKDIMEIFDELNEFCLDKVIDADIFVSFAKRSTSLPPHVDNHNVLLWQVCGRADLTVWNTEDTKVTTTLEVGDIAFIPWHQKHEITNPHGARATVSFGMETPEEAIENEEEETDD